MTPRLLACVLSCASLLFTVSALSPAHAQVQCWAPRQYEDTATDKRWARHLKVMEAAETIVKQSTDFMSPPVPVRMRTTMSAGPLELWNSRLFVRAYPKQTSVGIRLWEGECGIIPQADRVAGSDGEVAVFFNYAHRQMFLDTFGKFERTGTVAGYPEYSGWVLLTKNGRVPWIPQTLGDQLDRIGVEREKAAKEWEETKRSRNRVPDQATVDRTAALLRKTDPAGAEKYVHSMKQLAKDVEADQAQDGARDTYFTKRLSDYRAYRESFTTEQLAMPAVSVDQDGSGRKALDAQIKKLQELGTEDKQRVEEALRRSRLLERDAQAAAKTGNKAEADRLRAEAIDLSREAKQIRKDHTERAALKGEALRGDYELNNLKPGSAEQAFAFKIDPMFPDHHQPDKIQVITVLIVTLTDKDIRHRPEHAARKVWLDRVKASMDYAALAALLD